MLEEEGILATRQVIKRLSEAVIYARLRQNGSVIRPARGYVPKWRALGDIMGKRRNYANLEGARNFVLVICS